MSDEHETRWTDDRIRWTEDKHEGEGDGKDKDISEEDDDMAFIDPFKDSNPFTNFEFEFDADIHIVLRGYKTDADQVWQSTGVTLWRAAEHLGKYLAGQSNTIQWEKCRVLELGAGLGLCGILAHRLRGKYVCITDGDTDALKLLRENIETNRLADSSHEDGNETVVARQLLWGQATAQSFVERYGAFDVIIASDIIYAAVIVEPLWETVQTLLPRTSQARFIMAYARRKVPITIDKVLGAGDLAGFRCELVKEDDDEGIWIYEFRWKPEKCEA
jgi:predicted nicotinamide N-methyase